MSIKLVKTLNIYLIIIKNTAGLRGACEELKKKVSWQDHDSTWLRRDRASSSALINNICLIIFNNLIEKVVAINVVWYTMIHFKNCEPNHSLSFTGLGTNNTETL